MANGSADQNPLNSNQDETEKSFVGKFKSIISNTPLSKWFRRQDNTVRRRDFEEEVEQLQPPSKRAKFTDNQGNNISLLPTSELIEEKLTNRNSNNFIEPVAGPSGLHSRRLLNSVSTSVNSDITVHVFASDFLNGHQDSDSEESTSGYSSVPRIGSKEHVCQSEGSSKQPSPLQNNSPNRRSLFETPSSANRSLFVERTISPQLNMSLSSRRPQFNASTFGSPNFLDQTLSTERVISSPFYNGNTIYGGASAYENKFSKKSTGLQTSLKRSSVHIKPIKKNNGGGNLVLGKTARKILETLEQYSTPINDAKKIPISSKRVRLDTSLLGQHVGIKTYKSTETALTRELQVPTISELLKMKQKAKLQSSTEAVRHIAKSSKSDLNNVNSQQATNVTPHFIPQVIEKAEESIHIDSPKVLPSLPVPVSAKFDFGISPIVKKISEKLPETSTAGCSPLTQKVTQSDTIELNDSPTKPINAHQSITSGDTKKVIHKEVLNSSQFIFSEPLIIAENIKSIVAINNFKFSEPLSNIDKTDNVISKQFREKNNGQTIIKDTLTNSSSLDKFRPANGTWECTTCLIRNQAGMNKCIACETPKLKPVQTNILSNSTSLNKLKPISDTWECSTCLIRNHQETMKCIACDTPKPKPIQIEETKKFTFGNTFKMSENMWECSTCMIRNSNDCSKCVACETPNPKSSIFPSTSASGFGGKFQPPANSWECSTCLLRNKGEVDKCAACAMARVTNKAITKDPANSFKIKVDEWECSVCMVRNKETHNKCQCCEAAKPGSSMVIVKDGERKPVPKFNFGIDKASVTQFKFGIQPSTNAEIVPPKLPESIITTEKIEPIVTFGLVANAQKTTGVLQPVKQVENQLTVSTSNTIVTIPEGTKTIPVSSTLSQNETNSLSTKKIVNNINATQATTFGTASSPNPAFNIVGKKSPDKEKFGFVQPTSKGFAGSPKIDFPFKSPAKPPSFSTPSVFGQNEQSTSMISNNDLVKKTTFANPNKLLADVSSTKPVESQSFSFTKLKSNGTPATLFNFGQNSNPAAQPSTANAGGFNFGQAVKSPFLSVPVPETKKSGTNPKAFMFSGSGNETSTNGSFNFGGGNQIDNTQKVGFNFGAPPAKLAVSGFNFDRAPATTQATALPTGGFNFSSSFDANAKPTFNFSEGTVMTFSAQPSADSGAATAVAPRKIKRGIRRTQR